jgi:hypothetical protein
VTASARSARPRSGRSKGERSELLDGTLLLHDVIARSHGLSGELAALAGELAGAVSQISGPGALDEALDAVREQARQRVAETEQTRGEAQAGARRARVEAHRSADDARLERERAASAAREAGAPRRGVELECGR